MSRNPKALESVRGVGLMQGLKCACTNGDLMTATRDAGLLAVVAADNVLRILPPLTVSTEEIDEAMAKLDTACAALSG